ncbi:MAG: DMT family transporter [Patescibacteria group bacterium]
MTDRQKAFLSIVAVSLLGGATTAITKIGLVEIPSFSFIFLRFFVASVCIIPFGYLKKKNFRIYFKLAPLSLLAVFNIILFTIGIKFTTATIGQLLYAATPFLTSVILYLFYKEKIQKLRVFGLILGFVGTGLVILLPVIENKNPFSGDLLGNLLIGIGVISWAFYMVYSRKLLKDYSPFDVTSAFIFTTAIISLPFFAFELTVGDRWWEDISLNSIFALGYVAVVSTVITYLLNQYAIKYGGSVLASLSFYMLPIFAFMSAFVLLGEMLTIGLISGGALVLLGVYLVGSKK